MALDAYLNLTGDFYGKAEGSVTRMGRERRIEVNAVDHEVSSPRDATSGKSTGRRQHRPIAILKEVDRSSPILYSMLAENERASEWRLDFWRPSRSGRRCYTIELVDAPIPEIRTEMLDNKLSQNQTLPVGEMVAFNYQNIIWTWRDGGITAEDDRATRTRWAVASLEALPTRRKDQVRDRRK